MLYRLHNHDEYEGTGIGLSVCRKIIRDHGGEIWIESANPVGTRVVFTLVTPAGQDVETG
jgi:signal transduction histidine kinase